MKKILIGLATAASIVAPIATVVACGSTSGGVVVTSKEKVPTFTGTKIVGKHLGAIVSDPENPRWQKSKSYLQKNGEAAGFATATSIAKAAADQKTWITANLAKEDALIVGATDDSVAGSWSAWTDSAKPVIAYDRLIKNTSAAYNWYVTYNNSLVGDLQAKNILAAVYGDKSLATKDDTDILTYIDTHKLATEKSIVTVAGDPADNNATLFFNGAMKLLDAAIAKDSKLVLADPVFDTFNNVAQDKWDYAKGQSFLQAKISNLSKSKKSEIAAVLSPNDGMATSAINALRNNALDPKSIYITGQDSNDTAVISIFAGTGQDMTISKPDSQATAVAVALAKYLIKNPGQNVKPNPATIKDADILAAIKADFGNIEMLYDGTTYMAATNSPVNTILLTPKVVDKANLDQFFSVIKK